MGRYDDISDAKLRYEVQRFARILQRMEANGEVLDRTADILTLLGELRRMVFAWEVRCTFQDEEAGALEDPTVPEEAPGANPESDSERIVREAREQHSDFVGGLGPVGEEPPPPPGPDADLDDAGGDPE